MSTTKPSVLTIRKKGTSDIREVIAMIMTRIAMTYNQSGFLFIKHTQSFLYNYNKLLICYIFIKSSSGANEKQHPK